VRDGCPVVSVRRHTVDGARLATATIDFDKPQARRALTGGGVDGDTEYPVMTVADNIDTSAIQ
jgi:hypothetical protein